MSEFAILIHEMPAEANRQSHWDWMFEQGDGLATWAVEQWPQPGSPTVARRLPAHRRDYLDYEGPVSHGRGTVKRIARGPATIEVDEPGLFIARLGGDTYVGRVEFRQVDAELGVAADNPSGQRWTLVWEPD